jgi:DNA-binding transcriptional ArsR family regulator
MPATVRRLRTRRDREQQEALHHLREVVSNLADALPGDVLQRIGTLIDRRLLSQDRWSFVMVNADLYAEYVRYLRQHSSRPLLALQLLAELIRSLPDDSNEVQATRAELARRVGCDPANLSRLITEMEEAGIVSRERDGRGVRYTVNPLLGTHLAGKARDNAQGQAPDLKLEPKPSSKKRRPKLVPVD